MADSADVLLIIQRHLESLVAASDDSHTDLGLAKNEVVLSSDLFNMLYNKSTAEILSVADLAKLVTGKGFEESQPIASESSVQVSKPIDELAPAVDVSSILVGIPMADEISVADFSVASVNFGLEFSDSISLADSLEAAIPIIREFLDTVGVAGYRESLLNDLPFNALTLNGQIGGDYALISMEMPRGAADASSVSDAGYFVIQNYTLADYFAEDYVGTFGTL